MNFSLLEKIIKQRNLSASGLSIEMGYSNTAVSDALKRKDMKVSMLEKICKVLDISPAILFEENIYDNSASEPNALYLIPSKQIQFLENENTRLKGDIEFLKKQLDNTTEALKNSKCLYPR